jgi:Rad3-related DNA helicase
MSNYFGKDCEYFCGQWEQNDTDCADFYNKSIKEFTPVLVYCNHTNNPYETEGNCNPKDCPLGKEKTE